MAPISSDLPNIHAQMGLKPDHFQIWPATITAIEQSGWRIHGGQKGKGGFGAGFEVRHIESHAVGFVKIMLDPGNEDHVHAFDRECRVLASEHVPRDLVPAYINHVKREGIQPFVLMEFINGREVHSYVKEPRKLDLDHRIELVEKLFRAYQQLHDCNLIHGDPKPENIMVQKGDRIRLVDFGLSCRLDPGYAARSVSVRGGTPGYGDDEVVYQGKRPDRWHDLRGAAQIAFMILIDRDAPKDDSDWDHVLKQAGVPSGVRDVLIKASRIPDSTRLAKDPSVYQRAGDAADAISKWRINRDRNQQFRKQLVMTMCWVMFVGSIGALGWWKFNEERKLGDIRELTSLQRQFDSLGNMGKHPGVAQIARTASGNDVTVTEKIKSLTKAISAARDIEWAESILDPLRKVLNESPWQSLPAVQAQKDRLVKQFLTLTEDVQVGRIDELQGRVAGLHGDLAALARTNTEAAPAVQRKIEFERLVKSVDDEVQKKDGFVQIVRSAEEGAKQLLDKGDWKGAGLQYGQRIDHLNDWLKPENKNETEVQRKKRLEGNQETLAAVEREKEQLKADVERVTGEVTKQLTEIAKLNGQISKLTEERLDDARKVTDATTKLTHEEKLRKEAEGKVAGLESANTKLTSENAKLKIDSKALGELRITHTNTVQEFEKKKKELDQVNGDLVAARGVIEQLNNLPDDPDSYAEKIRNEIIALWKKIKEIDPSDLQKANEAYDEVRQRYAKLEGERQKLLAGFQPDAPKVKNKDQELAVAGQQLEAAFAKVDLAHQSLFDDYNARITIKTQELNRLTNVVKMLDTAPDVVKVRAEITELQKQQKAFAAGASRAAGTGKKLTLAQILKADPVSIFTNKTGIKVAVIPAGSFDMCSPASEAERSSDEGPLHKVQISKFEMGIYPVTQEQYQLVMGTNPSYFSATGGGKDKVKGLDTSQFPVESVSWYDGVEFCIKASEMDGLSPYYRMTDIVRDGGSIKSAKVTILGGNGWRLPTEAQREYAARAGTTTPFFFGSTLNGDHANIHGNYPYGTKTKGEYLERTTKAGSYSPNKFGLYDMSGNVWDWCYDVYDEKAYSGRSGTTKDPVVETGSEYRVLRGGSWYNNARLARSANRLRITPDFRYFSIGFRVVR